LAKLSPRLVRDADGKERYEIDPVQAAKLGTYVNPPKDPDVPPPQPVVATGSTGSISLASAESKPAPRAPAAKPEEGTLSRLTRWVGLSGNEPKPEPAKPSPAAKTATPAAPAQAARPSTAAAIQPRPRQQQEASAPEPPRTSFAPASQPLMSGATPVIGGDSFENRFGQMR
jgi:hypothetical protein